MIVAAFCEAHEVDSKTFATLTDAALLPCIDLQAVWSLLARERELLTPEANDPLSSLQKRCIEELAKDFQNIDCSPTGPLHGQSSVFMHHLFRKSQKCMKREIDEAPVRDGRVVRRRAN
jgi:hypothetical protein